MHELISDFSRSGRDPEILRSTGALPTIAFAASTANRICPRPCGLLVTASITRLGRYTEYIAALRSHLPSKAYRADGTRESCPDRCQDVTWEDSERPV